MLQDLQAQVITKKAQFPLVPDATLECQAWPGVKLSAMGVSRWTKEWEIAETGLPWMLNKYLFTKRDAKTQPKKPGYMGHHKTDYVANDRKSINNPNKHMGCMRVCSAQ